MSANLTIWQAAIWITLFFVSLSLILQFISNKQEKEKSRKISELIGHNKDLSAMIVNLQDRITSLNADLISLTKENKKLKEEIETLNIRVNKLQSQMTKS